jgi:hypothetical protein
MNPEAILKRLDEERRSLVSDGNIVEVLPEVTRLRSVDNVRHTIIHSSLTAENADSIIVREIEHHRQLGVKFEWKVYGHDQPADLQDRLARHGFQIEPREAVLVHDLAEWIAEAHSHRIRLVDNVEQVETFRRVASEVFGKDYRLTATELARAIQNGSTQHRGYIAYIGDDPAGVGRLYTHPRSAFGGLYGGGTRPRFRHCGIYRALIAARAQDAKLSGAQYLIVDARPTSQPILRRLGFTQIADMWPAIWRP